MKETTEIIEPVEMVETAEQETVKPYEFRKLSSDDLFLMLTIIKKIGLKEFKKCVETDQLKEHIKAYQAAEPGEGKEKALLALGVAVGLDAVDLILGNLPKCKSEIYQLLAQVSGMPEDDIKADMILFTEMVIDFFKKAEFPAFIKVVSRLFK